MSIALNSNNVNCFTKVMRFFDKPIMYSKRMRIILDRLHRIAYNMGKD